MYPLIAETGIQYVLMYCKNNSGHADREPVEYPDGIVSHVTNFFHTQIALAEQGGVSRSQIILDP